MPQIARIVIIAVLAAGLLVLAIGCGNSDSLFNPDTGKHTTSWLPEQHAAAVTTGTTSLGAPLYFTGSCIECHGADLSGGISQVSCTDCHMGGPTAVHPATWDPVYLNHGPTASADGTAQCSNLYCHGPSLGGVASSGPACTTCHSWPFTPGSLSCDACHRLPPNGSAFPNIAGKHAKHATSVLATCDICHSGASGYDGGHRNGVVNVAIMNNAGAYTPKSGGTPTFNAGTGTCSNISCHGAQQTPSWFTGAINVNAQCNACHASGTNQYNSYNSGEHSKHMGISGITCTECHDTTKLAPVHFNDLSTTTMTEADQTILDSRNYNGSSCLFTCHIRNEQHDRGMNW